MATSLIKLVTRRLLFNTSQNPRWPTVSTTLTSQNKQFLNSCVGLWFMTIDYVNSEMLWLHTLQGYLKNGGCERL